MIFLKKKMLEVNKGVETENNPESLNFASEELKQEHMAKVFITKKPEKEEPQVERWFGGGMGVDMCNSPEYSQACLEAGVMPTMSAAMPALGERENYDKIFGNDEQKMTKGRAKFIKEKSTPALEDKIKKVREVAPHGIVSLNIMFALFEYDERLKSAGNAGRDTGKVDKNGDIIRERGVDVVFVGAGVDRELGNKMCEYPHMKYVPIVSSARIAKIIMKGTKRKVDKNGKEIARRPDAILLEDPNKAGGHLGRLKPTIEDIEFDPKKELLEMREHIKEFYGEDAYIPIIYAGGISYKEDIDEIMAMGFDGVEFATRLLLTEESSAPNEIIREKYLTANSVVTTLESSTGYASNSLEKTKGKEIVQREAKHVAQDCFDCIKRCTHINSAREIIELKKRVKKDEVLSEKEQETLDAGVQGSCIAIEMGKARHGIEEKSEDGTGEARHFAGRGLTIIQNDSIYFDKKVPPIKVAVKFMREPGHRKEKNEV